MTTRFFSDAGRLMVNTEGADGRMTDFDHFLPETLARDELYHAASAKSASTGPSCRAACTGPASSAETVTMLTA